MDFSETATTGIQGLNDVTAGGLNHWRDFKACFAAFRLWSARPRRWTILGLFCRLGMAGCSQKWNGPKR